MVLLITTNFLPKSSLFKKVISNTLKNIPHGHSVLYSLNIPNNLKEKTKQKKKNRNHDQ